MRPAEVGHRQVHRTGQRGHAQQTQGGGAVGVAFGGDQGGGDGHGRPRPETAHDRADDDGRDGGGERGGAVAEEGQREPEAGQCPGAEAPHPGGQQEARGRRTQQQRAADGARLRGGQRKAGVESAHGGGQQVRRQVAGREKGDEGPGSGAGGEHGRSQGMRKGRWEEKRGRRPSIERGARGNLYQAWGGDKQAGRCDLDHIVVCLFRSWVAVLATLAESAPFRAGADWSISSRAPCVRRRPIDVIGSLT